ncbi:MAG: SRPBCC domain-containing protein [Bacteroidia bacterium]|nr:SRPBCC domain-containing protein [Bacteroidia bacterium]
MNTTDNRTLTLERIFDAPIDLVWEAWTKPDHIVKWWAPEGMMVQVVAHDFRVGGKWKYTMPMPDGSEFVSEGEYTEIEEGRKIVTSANFRPMTEGVELQAIFEESGDKTKFTFNVVHATEAYCRQQEEMGFYNGWGSTFERLNALVSA